MKRFNYICVVVITFGTAYIVYSHGFAEQSDNIYFGIQKNACVLQISFKMSVFNVSVMCYIYVIVLCKVKKGPKMTFR